jgi:hypothetical protein
MPWEMNVPASMGNNVMWDSFAAAHPLQQLA